MQHVNVRTGYSFLRAYGTPELYIERAHKLGATVLGVADYCSTWSHVPFQKACKKAGIQALLGVQLPVCLVLDKDPRHDLVTLIPRDTVALGHLYKAVSRARAQMYFRPRLTWNQIGELTKHGIEVIVDYLRADPDVQGLVSTLKYPVALRPVASPLLGGIRAGDFTPIAAIGPAMPRIEHVEALEMIRSISGQHRIGEVEIEPLHAMSEKEYVGALKGLRVEGKVIEEAQARLRDLVSGCSAEIPRARNVSFKPGSLDELVDQGLHRRGMLPLSADYQARLDEERNVIKEKNFEDYFVFVARLVGWAKERMFVGPGRGSSGGSLLCYILGITEVDPLVHGTLFERFIDITRNDWPDIDVDFPDLQRHMVIEHIAETYGAAQVAKLGTISEFQLKSAINDTARALKVPYEDARLLSRMVSEDMDLHKAMEQPGVKAIIDQYPNFKRALLIEGHPRHHGVHAAGVVVAAEPINTYASTDEEGVAALTLQDAEDIGLLKMDALGLRTLTVIETCCEEAGIRAADLYALPLDDDAVYETFRKDALTGVFQFEGSTVRGLTRRIHVDRFSDLCALTSLARPGPLEGGAAENWVKRRNGQEEVVYEHPLLEAYLGDTLGTVVYQEQMMNIVRYIADFDVPAVNKFRKAIGKKLPEELKKFEARFLENASPKTGMKIAKSLWHQMEESGSYAFNFSHAVAYSMLSYLTAYLKTYYPLEYALAQLRNAKGEDQSRSLLQELDRDGQKIIVFDPLVSDVDWSIKDGALVGGFLTVRGIGLKTAQGIVKERTERPVGWYTRLSPGVLKKIENPENWAWADVGRVQRRLRKLYEDPDNFITETTPAGVRGPATRICDIPTGKGSYLIAGEIIKKTQRDGNDKDRVAKRGSQVAGPSLFLNLILDDGTGEIGVTINRFKYAQMGAQIWEDDAAVGRVYLLRGTCINDSGRWLMVDSITCIHDVMTGEMKDDERGELGTGTGAAAGEADAGAGDAAVGADEA